MGVISGLRPGLQPGLLAGLNPRAGGGGGGPPAGNGFDDDFESAGSLNPAIWTTRQAPTVDQVVTIAGGEYRSLVDDNAQGVNRSLWFGSSQGRFDYQTPGAPPFRFEAYKCGAGTIADPTVPLTYAANEFQLAGILLHVPNLATATYYGLFAGHRGAQQFTVENKNNLSGSSSTNDEGPNVHTGFADLAMEVDGAGVLTAQYRNTGDTTWITCTRPVGNPPGAVGNDWLIGLVGYMFDQFKRDFVAVVGGWAKVS